MNKIILDIDGTLACADHRAHWVNQQKPNWEEFLRPDRVALDTPFPEAQRAFKEFVKLTNPYGNEIIFLTGRNESLREVTTEWLLTYYKEIGALSSRNLIMRPIGDMDKPTVYKARMLGMMERSPGELNIAIDDDPYMQPVYLSMGIVPLHAPDCWSYICKRGEGLPTEQYWRR